MSVYDDTNRPSTADEYEQDLRWALDGHHAAREKFLRTEDNRDLPEIARWAQAVTEIAQAVTIVRDTIDLPPDQADRIDAMLAATVETRQAASAMRRVHDDDHPVEWGDSDLYPHLHLIDWPTAWTADDDGDAEWLIEPLFAEHRGHAVYAKAGQGKSWTVLAAMLAAATGKPFLKQPAGPPRRVLYLDYEMTFSDLMERVEANGYGPGDDLSYLHYALIPDLPPINTRDGGRDIVDIAVSLAAEVVVIDTTGRAVVGKENDADTYLDLYRYCGQLLKAAGITFIRVDHAGKDLDAGQRGSSGKGDDVDIVWQITRTDVGQRWTATKRRPTWVPPALDLDVVEGDDGVWRFAANGAGWPAGTRELADLLDDLGVPIDTSRRRVKADHGDAVKARATVLSAAIRYRRERAAIGGIDLPPDL